MSSFWSSVERGIRQGLREVVMLFGSIALVIGVLSGAAAVTPAHASSGAQTDILRTQYIGMSLATMAIQPAPPVRMVKTRPVSAPSITILKVRVVDPPPDYGCNPPAALSPWVDPPPQTLPWPQ